MQRLALFVVLSTTAGQFTGDGTTYGPPDGGDPGTGNCALMNFLNFAPGFHVAINNEQWGEGVHCGRCVLVQCIDPRCTSTKAVRGQVTDRCPECSYGDLDMSLPLFQQVTGYTTDRLKISWKFVDYPVLGGVQVCAKSGSSTSWLAVQASNTVNGVKRMSINGENAPLFGGTAYYFKSQVTGVPLDSTKVQMTLFTGESISTTVSLQPDQCTQISQQFSAEGNVHSEVNATVEPTTTSKPTSLQFPNPTPLISPASQTWPSSKPNQTILPYQVPTSLVPQVLVTSLPTETTSQPPNNTSPPVVTARDPNSINFTSSRENDSTMLTATIAPSATTNAPLINTAVNNSVNAADATTIAPSSSVAAVVNEVRNKASGGGLSVGSVLGYGLTGCIAVAVVVVGVVFIKSRQKINRNKNHDNFAIEPTHTNIAVL